ncbi:hypothetical protein SAMN06295905_1772 [Devosia lucknowensis]|uniref:HdeA/HdeB family protein n=1 Tax=Devosia lucknowensis TaxID=1096929 RepID=A0A1Y6F5P6_9HYPH|nr:hypothetical protein [Devosia lucknowensis]SMQ70097.1 hypothetical protein SAMN06295905_1772 [Devosia lucknowensis]
MTIKSALSVVALAAGLVAAPVLAQAPTMIGSQTVAEADVGAVQGRCADLKTQAETESLTAETATTEEDDNETAVAGDATVTNEPALTESASASAVDLAVVTLEDCEAGGWFNNM